MKACYNCQQNVNEDFKFCPHCGVKLTQMECPKCGYINEPNSKFCQECGTKLDYDKTATPKQSKKSDIEDTIEIIEPAPNYGITVEFPFSSSQTFDFAVISAKKFSSFKQIGDSKKPLYRVTVNEDEIETLDDLLENLKGWRNRTVYVKGEKVLWESVFSYSWCYKQKKNSFKPDLYCFGYENEWEYNLWGCIQAHLSFSENSELFTFGKWLNNGGDWQFDKERIQHNLQKNIFQMRFCPALKLNLIEDVLKAFPDKVNPSIDKNWKFIQNWGSEVGLPVKVKQFGIVETVYMKCVAPIDKIKFMKDITTQFNIKLPEKLL
jgi:RNA polymerase subunit RPABC4/transcription elongation factor Spt4